MPNREQRRHAALSKWLEVEDASGNPYHVYLKDISGKDEVDFLQQMTQMGIQNVGLCDLFFKGTPSLTVIAGLIWVVRRKFEKRLTVMDVLDTVNMACIDTLDMHDGTEEAKEETVQSNGSGQGSPGFNSSSGAASSDVGTATSGRSSAPSTA